MAVIPHKALGDYQTAVSNFEAAADAMLVCLRDVEAKAKLITPAPHSGPTLTAIAALASAAALRLSPGYAAVAAAAKGR